MSLKQLSAFLCVAASLVACDAPPPTLVEDAALFDLPGPAFATVGTSGHDRTVGLLFRQSGANGYYLISPFRRTDAFLLDLNGKLVQRWDTEFVPGASATLTEEGTLLRAARIGCAVHPVCADEPLEFNNDGRGGLVQEFAWDGDLLWEYELATPTQRQHHEVMKMPNGNLLMVAWELQDAEAQTAAGRTNPITTGSPPGLWSDVIYEVDPDTDEVVWEWHAWDHLGANDLRTIDVNLTNANSWSHINSIDYDPELDQILLSSNRFSELWIIDHSTTSEEASGDTGGRSGVGGDILFRWGNPANYGGTADRKNWNQHNAKWVKPGLPGAGNITFYHNGGPRGYSSADVISPVMEDGAYVMDEATSSYLPLELTASYALDPGESSSFVSSAVWLPNGNFLVTSGAVGLSQEITKQGRVVWKYLNPAQGPPAGFAEQGGTVAPGMLNLLFRATHYDENFAGLEGKDLTPGYPLELPPLVFLDSAIDALDALNGDPGLSRLEARWIPEAHEAALMARDAWDAGRVEDFLAAVDDAVRSVKAIKNGPGMSSILADLHFVADWDRPH